MKATIPCLALCLIAELVTTSSAAPGPDADRIQAIAAMLSETPRGVGPRIADREAWEAAARALAFRNVIHRAEMLLNQSIPETTDDLYLDYSRTGNRTNYERVHFARVNRLSTLVLAECLENHGRFLPAIDATLRALLAQKSWVLPAHDGSLAVFHGTTLEIDLFAAAIGADLATVDYWLGDKLPKKTRTLLHSELERRIFQPFAGMVLHGQPREYWLKVTNNWNAVCLAGVTVAATTALQDRQRRAFFIAAAEKYSQNFLKGITPDGYCSEGLGYWNYGFGHFLLLTETIFQATRGRIDLCARDRVRAAAQFGHKLAILPGVYPAFSDCALDEKPDAATEAYVSRRYGFGWRGRGARPAAGVRART